MKKTNFTPTATVILQMLAHQEHECIINDGKVYVELPTPSLDVSASDAAPEEEEGDAPKKSRKGGKRKSADKPADKPSKKVTKEEPKKPSKKVETYEEKELMKMKLGELKNILEDLGIDPDKEDGRNTNKKLRVLILDAQKGGVDAGEEEEEEDDDEGSEGTGDLGKDVRDILDRLDSAELSEKAAIKELAALSEDSDKGEIKEIIDEFMEEADKPIEDFVGDLVEALGGSEEEEGEEGEEEEEGEEVELGDLEKGDKIHVTWEDSEEEYDGEVISVKRGKVTVKWDEDGETEVLDPEEEPIITLLD